MIELNPNDDLNAQLAEQMEAQSEEFEELLAERDALVQQNLTLADAMGYGDNKRELESLEEYAARLLAERNKLREALSAMLTHMGMDEDEWNKPTFNQARAALRGQ